MRSHDPRSPSVGGAEGPASGGRLERSNTRAAASTSARSPLLLRPCSTRGELDEFRSGSASVASRPPRRPRAVGLGTTGRPVRCSSSMPRRRRGLEGQHDPLRGLVLALTSLWRPDHELLHTVVHPYQSPLEEPGGPEHPAVGTPQAPLGSDPGITPLTASPLPCPSRRAADLLRTAYPLAACRFRENRACRRSVALGGNFVVDRSSLWERELVVHARVAPRPSRWPRSRPGTPRVRRHLSGGVLVELRTGEVELAACTWRALSRAIPARRAATP